MGWPSIVELRQYTLLPGKRDVLIDLFESNLVEPQERCGMRIIGTFRDLDDEARFVWLRGFPSMDDRKRSLAEFYGGSIWRRNRDAANATMVDSDDLLLLSRKLMGWGDQHGVDIERVNDHPIVVGRSRDERQPMRLDPFLLGSVRRVFDRDAPGAPSAAL